LERNQTAISRFWRSLSGSPAPPSSDISGALERGAGAVGEGRGRREGDVVECAERVGGGAKEEVGGGEMVMVDDDDGWPHGRTARGWEPARDG
jgi:hypothetical protein